MKKFIISAMVMSIGLSAFAGQNYSYQTNTPAPQYNSNGYINESYKVNNNTLKGRIVTVPSGEVVRAVVTTPVSSQTAVLGQNVSLALGSDFYYGGNLIAPAGSTVNGSVVAVSNAKHGNINGKLSIRFTQILTPTGQNIPISAVIKTDDYTGVLVGGTKLDVTKEYAKDLAIGAGAGALAGVIISPLAGGAIGQGTALATAVGAGGGLVKSVWDKGKDVTIPTNATVELVLTQPITVSPMSQENSLYGE